MRSPAARRYLWRFAPSMVGYVVVLLGANRLTDAWRPAGATLALLSVAPAVPLLAVIWAMGMYLLEERDEFVRHRLVRSMVVATGAVLAILTVWGFLANRAVIEDFPAMLVFPLWCACMGIAQMAAKLRDRVTGAGA